MRLEMVAELRTFTAAYCRSFIGAVCVGVISVESFGVYILRLKISSVNLATL